MGQFLYRRYNKLLLGAGDYSSENVQIKSVDKDRCLMSAQCSAAGLFQQINNSVSNDANCTWPPVPIHIVPYQGNCHELSQLAERYLKTDEIKALLLKYRGLRRFMEYHSQNRVRFVNDFVIFNDVLNVEHSNGFRYEFILFLNVCGESPNILN